MTRFVIGPDVALRLAREKVVVPSEHELLAPTLMRSQLLALLYRAVQGGEMDRGTADEYLDFVRGMRVRLLGDRVLQRVAWRVAERLGWSDTLDAEYVALTQLQADALVTLDDRLAAEAEALVAVAPYATLVDDARGT
jgi:predicted nucleic acid-binding protein